MNADKEWYGFKQFTIIQNYRICYRCSFPPALGRAQRLRTVTIHYAYTSKVLIKDVANLGLLKIIHSEEVIKSRRGSYAFWNRKTNQEIIDSFQLLPLFAKEDGRIMNGNTRMYILQERGIEINSLILNRNNAD